MKAVSSGETMGACKRFVACTNAYLGSRFALIDSTAGRYHEIMEASRSAVRRKECSKIFRILEVIFGK
jgi:hypothetical protein